MRGVYRVSMSLHAYFTVTHLAISAAFAADQLGTGGNQLLFAWIAMRIPFPIGTPRFSY